MVQTILAPDEVTNEQAIKRAVSFYLNGLIHFILPQEEGVDSRFTELYSDTIAREQIITRLRDVEPFVADILHGINTRSKIINSAEYRMLIKTERKQWQRAGDPEKLQCGARVCVDAGVPREAVIGSEDHMGRTLAGDDKIYFDEIRGTFFLGPTTFAKKLIHEGRMGMGTFLELLIEHTGCGRRSQMLANLTEENNGISRQYRQVFANISALHTEFPIHSQVTLTRDLYTIRTIWNEGKMASDGGIWAGIWVKIAQRQAYKALKQNSDTSLNPVVPIELYDKYTGDLLVGLDQLSVLTHKAVLDQGGYTTSALKTLIAEKSIFSMVHWLQTNRDYFQEKLNIQLGARTFSQLQNEWFEVKTQMVHITQELWDIFENGSKSNPVQEMVEQFLILSLPSVQKELLQADEQASTDGVTSDFVIRRYIHQLFRAFSYAWLLDTPNRGNVPGQHIEDHMATGDSAVLGVREHLPLGQGDMDTPNVFQFITGYAVLMHSEPGKTGSPVVVMMKHDTDRPNTASLTSEESRQVMDDFRILLFSLWPYIVVGDIVPIIAIRDHSHGGIGRLARSPIDSFGDMLRLEGAKQLPDLVYASTSKGEVVKVPAQQVLSAGIKKTLPEFRKAVVELADSLADPSIQKRLALS